MLTIREAVLRSLCCLHAFSRHRCLSTGEKDFAMYIALLKIVLHFEGAWFQFNGLAATKKAVQQRAVTKAPWRRSFRNFSLCFLSCT